MELATPPAPRISAVLPNYNYARYVTRAVDSLLSQSVAADDLEVIVVDDASTDDSWGVLQRYRADPRVVLLRHEQNAGIAASWNDGMRVARGRYIVSLDADDFVLQRDALALEAGLLDTDHAAALVLVDHVIVDEDDRPLGRKRTRVPRRMSAKDAFRRLLVENFVTHSGVMLRAACIAELGGYDPQFLFNQDYELWLRIASRWDFLHIARSLFAYRFHRHSMFFRTVDAGFAMRAHRQVLDRASQYSPLPDTARLIRTSMARAHLTTAAMLFARGDRPAGVSSMWTALRVDPRALISRSGARAVAQLILRSILGERAGGIGLEMRRRIYDRLVPPSK